MKRIMNDLREHATNPATVRRPDGRYLLRRGGMQIIHLSQIGTVFRLEVRRLKSSDKFSEDGEIIVADSVDDYKRWFERQCDG